MDDGGSQLITGLVVFLCLLIVNGVCNVFAAAFRGVSEIDMEKREEDFFHLVHIMEVLMGILIGYLVLTRSLHIAAVIGIGLSLVLIFCIFGIYFPRMIGKRYEERAAVRLVGIIKVLLVIVSPLLLLIKAVVWVITCVFRIPAGSMQDDVTEEEIISMVKEGHEQGVLEANEAEMIHNIFAFDDKEAKDIMTHRKNIVAIDGAWTLEEAAGFMLEANNSRFPVYEEDIDNITGIIHLKDAMKCLIRKSCGKAVLSKIPGLVRPAVFIPETRKINLLFQDMQAENQHMVIVADEYGQTAGLLALEDILEVIVGNIQDEYDEDETLIEELEAGKWLISGMIHLDDLQDFLGIVFELEADIETLSGYLVTKIGRIPAEDETAIITEAGYQFEIISVADKTIEKVEVTKLPEAAEEGIETEEKKEIDKER